MMLNGYLFLATTTAQILYVEFEMDEERESKRAVSMQVEVFSNHVILN